MKKPSNMNINTHEYWDRVYRKKWNSGVAQSDRYVRDYGEVHDAIVALIAPGSRVLDIACGLGLLCRKISKLVPCALVTGVDFSPFAMSRAAERVRTLGIGYLCLDIRSGLGRLGPEFDVVIMGEILVHCQ
jgi:2-polyprenyl-3-methyl-5-hydroxy-6-metoxy-1,4-benzoquinol methylase